MDQPYKISQIFKKNPMPLFLILFFCTSNLGHANDEKHFHNRNGRVDSSHLRSTAQHQPGQELNEGTTSDEEDSDDDDSETEFVEVKRAPALRERFSLSKFFTHALFTLAMMTQPHPCQGKWTSP